MRILLAQKLPYVPALSGASKFARALLEGLAQRNHSCRVLALMDAPNVALQRAHFQHQLDRTDLRATATSSGIEVFHCNGVEVHSVSDGLRLGAHLVEQMKSFKPTWTLVSEDPTYLLLTAATEVDPRRTVFLSLSQATLPFGPESFSLDPSKAHMLRQVAGIITLGHYLKNYIHRWSGLESVVTSLPLYGTGPFPYLGSFDNRFVTMINPSAIKGGSILLELARRLPDIDFAAVPTWATTTADRIALQQVRNIRLLMADENIDAIFAQTRVLIVPSLWGEAFGMIVIEAMLRGIPVVASNVGGLPEAKLGIDYVLPVRPIERYEDRRDDKLLPVPMVPDQDVGPWLEALRLLLSDREHYHQLSTASRRAASDYVSTLSFEPVEKYLESLLLADETLNGRHDQESHEFPNRFENLSSERLQLLARLLGKNV